MKFIKNPIVADSAKAFDAHVYIYLFRCLIKHACKMFRYS